MESALSSLIIFAVGLYAAVTISFTYLETQDSLWTVEQSRQEEILQRERTRIDLVHAETQSDGSIIRVVVRNSGQMKLSDYERWDVVVEYYAAGENEEDPNVYAVEWLPYAASGLTELHWTISGIYLDAATLTPEAFEPGIFNPDEEMVIQAQMAPSVAMTSTNRMTISSINGINDSIHIIR